MPQTKLQTSFDSVTIRVLFSSRERVNLIWHRAAISLSGAGGAWRPYTEALQAAIERPPDISLVEWTWRVREACKKAKDMASLAECIARARPAKLEVANAV